MKPTAVPSIFHHSVCDYGKARRAKERAGRLEKRRFINDLTEELDPEDVLGDLHQVEPSEYLQVELSEEVPGMDGESLPPTRPEPIKKVKTSKNEAHKPIVSVPKKLCLKRVEPSIVPGLNLKPVSPTDIERLVKKKGMKSDPEAMTDMPYENQKCLDDSLQDKNRADENVTEEEERRTASDMSTDVASATIILITDGASGKSSPPAQPAPGPSSSAGALPRPALLRPVLLRPQTAGAIPRTPPAVRPTAAAPSVLRKPSPAEVRSACEYADHMRQQHLQYTGPTQPQHDQEIDCDSAVMSSGQSPALSSKSEANKTGGGRMVPSEDDDDEDVAFFKYMATLTRRMEKQDKRAFLREIQDILPKYERRGHSRGGSG